MSKSIFKIMVAMSFLLLLTVPASFYKRGPLGALMQTAVVVLAFMLTVSTRRWMKLFQIDSPPLSLNARILTGLAFTIVFALLGEWGYSPFVYVLQTPLLLGLFGRSSTSWWFTISGLLKKREYIPGRDYIPVIVIFTIGLISLFTLFWFWFRWWSFLVVPVFFLGAELAELIGMAVRRWTLALEEVWNIARQMGPPIGGFVLGYLVIAFIFAGLYASVWRADFTAFKGLSEHPHFIDFLYYSVMTISTTGYGDVTSSSPIAKILASAEALIAYSGACE